MKERVILSLFRFKFRMTVVLLLLIMLLAACVYNAGRDSIDRTTVVTFNLDNFMGRWYEIARFDHSFERGLREVTADYRLQEDGMVEVINSGIRGDKRQQAIGRAKRTADPGRLRVSFFWIFYSDYNILDMGPEGGSAGGELVAEGTPEDIMKVERSYTGQFLKELKTER